MLKLCIFITGYSGAGKSTLANYLSMRGFHTLHTGDIFRENRLSADEGGSVTPFSAEEIIKDGISMFLRKHMDSDHPSLCAIETYPRGVHQIPMMDMARYMGWAIICVGVNADVQIRRSRVMSRDMSDPKRMNNDIHKLAEEIHTLPELFNMLRMSNTPFFELDTTNGNYSMSDECSAMDRFIVTASNLFKRKAGTVDVGRPNQSPVETCNLQIHRAIGELHECLQTDNIQHKLEEMADAFIFLMSGIASITDNPSAIVKHIIQKNNINHHRIITNTKPHNHVLKKDGV